MNELDLKGQTNLTGQVIKYIDVGTDTRFVAIFVSFWASFLSPWRQSCWLGNKNSLYIAGNSGTRMSPGGVNLVAQGVNLVANPDAGLQIVCHWPKLRYGTVS